VGEYPPHRPRAVVRVFVLERELPSGHRSSGWRGAEAPLYHSRERRGRPPAGDGVSLPR